MISYITLAQLHIKIEHTYEELRKLCKKYLSAGANEDFTISINQKDIEADKRAEDGISYQDSYVETIAALRKIAELLPYNNRLLCHGAAITYGDRGAFLFTAPSGTGKTTHINLWRQFLSDKADIINGDKPFLHIEKNHVQVYGSPWAGKEGWQKNRDARLNGICILEQGPENRIRRLSPEECLNRLFHQIYIPHDLVAAGLTLELFDRLLQLVPVYILTCSISEEAVKVSFETLTALKYEEEKKDED